jgi:uncharacterized protein YndB with AHSA1/START domain
MSTPTATRVTVSATINKPVADVWTYYTEPKHITQWNAASPDWHSPRAENDLRVGGRFSSRMEARDGSVGFDFEGTYTAVKNNAHFAYAMGDGRKVEVSFAPAGNSTKVTVIFDAETENPVEMQRGGWQAILDNFKAYAEKQA